MNILKNKWLIGAILWFGLAIYGLIVRQSSPDHIPMFPHFDKVAHCLLFFCQFWLLARACWTANRQIPYALLTGLALLMAVGTEWAQAAFTTTRTADVWDGVADMFGTLIALRLAYHATQIWTRQSTEIKAE